MLARGMANEGLTNVSEKLEAASNSEYTDFDQKVVVGTRVTSAMNSFKGKRVAILVATQGLTDKVATSFTADTAVSTGMMSGTTAKYSSILTSTAVVAGHESMVFAFGARPGSGSIEAADRKALPASSSGKTNDKQLTFVQYNALLEGTDNTGVVTAGNTNSVIWWNSDHYVFSGAYRSDDGGKTMFDLVWANTTKTGTTEVIPSAARFNANLLKDENGVILGVVFQQVGA